VPQSPIQRLVVACARPPSAEGATAIAAVAERPDLDWAGVVAMAAYHRLLGRTAKALERAGAMPSAPLDVAEELREAYLLTMGHNLVLAPELERVVCALAAAGVESMALKGAAWVPLVYDDWGLRDVGDLDLLVHVEDLASAQDAVRGLGYEASETAELIHHAPTLVREDGLVSVELHHHLGLRGTLLDFEPDAMWARAAPTRRGRAELLLPAAEDIFIHVALHFFGDRTFPSQGGALGQLADVAVLLDRFGPDLDWDLIAGEASRLGFGVGLALVLMTVAVVFETSVGNPDAWLAAEGLERPVVDEFVRHAVIPSPEWEVLGDVSGRFPSLRQLLPPNPARWKPSDGAGWQGGALLDAYRRWIAASVQALGRPRDIRSRARLDRRLQKIARRDVLTTVRHR
jgi:hypothetical protein